MFLKRVEAQGFKSFADKTIISFPVNGLVGFVGPNGSGKSNINDAIKWVLGEQSAKSLRGGSMTDIIFAGSKDKKPSDICEVTLIFNNSSKILNSEYTEVSVTRRLYRNQQENEYFINKERCRLKDIRYLMMNTGLGKNSFSIVSQGSIHQLADAKPIERKSIFEEAAGVSIYKDQKIESLRKLDRTNQNLNIIEVSVEELKKQVKPLEKQASKAKIYLNKRVTLEKYEVSLISEELKYDLEEINKVNELIKSSELEKDVKSSLVNNNQNKTTNINQKLIILEDEINQLNYQQRDVQSKINDLAKNNVGEVQEDIDKDNIYKLIEEMIQEELLIKEQISNSQKVIDSINSQKTNSQNIISETSISLDSSKYDISRIKFEKEQIENKIKHKHHLANGPATVIKNKGIFSDVIDTVGHLFNVDTKHELAIQTALGFSGAQNIVVRSDSSIKNIINFLKKGKYGRATFLPLNLIKQRRVDEKSYTILKSQKGFEGVASDIVQYRDEVKPAMKFLLGNNIIFDNIDNAISASKMIEGKYKIITLDGDIINPGFSMTGGTKSSAAKTLNLDDKLENIKSEISIKEVKLQDISNSLNIHRNTLEELNDQLSIKGSTLARLEEKYESANKKTIFLKEQYKKIMGKAYQGESELNVNSHSLGSYTSSLDEINEQLEIKTSLRMKYSKEQQDISSQISGWNKDLINEMDKLTDLKVEQNQLETRIGYNLRTLNNDYQLTLQSIKDRKWDLKESKEEVREIVHSVKEELSKLGYVNVDAVEQYDELKNRYDNLDSNYKELIAAQKQLLDTIEILDNKMKDSLISTVQKIRDKFKIVFKEIFRGGEADLKWEDEDDILNSGIEVIAKPPGKEIKNITLFSGGEKSMIAVTLIFAILQVSKLPLLILDEAEAALDEANVNRYARYCLELNKLTQVILVTHRPGTMENCDLLYGVTMEQKGITKLLSIKLEQAKEIVK